MKYAIMLCALGLCGAVQPLVAQEATGEAATEKTKAAKEKAVDHWTGTLNAKDVLLLPTMVGQDGRPAVISGAASLLPAHADLWTGVAATVLGGAQKAYARPVPLVTDDEGRFSLSNMAAGLIVAEDGDGFVVQSGNGSTLAWLGATDDGRLLLPKSSTVWFMPNDVTERAQIGVNMSEVDDALATQLGLDRERSALIVGVIEGWPAAKAGVRMYDVVTAVDGMTDAGVEQIKEAIRAKSAGESVTLTLIRAGRPLTLDVAVHMVEVEGRWATAYQTAEQDGVATAFDTKGWYWKTILPGDEDTADVFWDTRTVWDATGAWHAAAASETSDSSEESSNEVSQRLDRMEAMLAELLKRGSK